jgi:hypothetical protein
MTATNWLCVSIKTTDTFVNALRDTLALAKVQVAAKIWTSVPMARTIATVTLSARIRQETSPVRATMDLQATAMAPKVAQTLMSVH